MTGPVGHRTNTVDPNRDTSNDRNMGPIPMPRTIRTGPVGHRTNTVDPNRDTSNDRNMGPIPMPRTIRTEDDEYLQTLESLSDKIANTSDLSPLEILRNDNFPAPPGTSTSRPSISYTPATRTQTFNPETRTTNSQSGSTSNNSNQSNGFISSMNSGVSAGIPGYNPGLPENDSWLDANKSQSQLGRPIFTNDGSTTQSPVGRIQNNDWLERPTDSIGDDDWLGSAIGRPVDREPSGTRREEETDYWGSLRSPRLGGREERTQQMGPIFGGFGLGAYQGIPLDVGTQVSRTPTSTGGRSFLDEQRYQTPPTGNWNTPTISSPSVKPQSERNETRTTTRSGPQPDDRTPPTDNRNTRKSTTSSRVDDFINQLDS